MSSNEEIIDKLNALKEEFMSNLYKDKSKAEEVKAQIKQVLQDAPDGTEMYRVIQETSSGWTAYGSYSDTRATMKTLKKENGVWEMYGRKENDLDDASLSIVFNEGKLMSKADAQAELDKLKVNDSSSHRDIVNVGTDKWGNPIGQSTNRIEYPNKKEEGKSDEESKKVCENTSSVDWEEENFDLIWDEYAKRKSKELGVTRDEIPEWGEDGFDEELYNEVAWELYNSDAGLPDPDMYMESKEPISMSKEDIMSCYISDITEAAYTYTPQEAQKEIDNIFDDIKNDKDLDDVDKRFILKMVRGTLLNRDIKFTEITENKKVEAKYGDTNPDKIVPDAYCEIEKTGTGYYINCGIGTHTSLGGGNFTIYPEDYLSNLHKEVKKLAKERGIKRVYDKVKTMIPEYNAMIPEYNANIEDMIKNLTPFAEKSKQGQLTRADLDSIEEITGKITPNRMSTLPEFEWSGKFGRLRSLIGNLERYKTDLSNPLASADTITITESKEVKTEATVSKFQTMTTDKDGNEMLLKDVSYNNACSWLEKELAKAGNKVTDTETQGNKTIIKTDNKTKFEYDEDTGTLKRLEEAKPEEDKEIWNNVENIVNLVDTEIEPYISESKKVNVLDTNKYHNNSIDVNKIDNIVHDAYYDLQLGDVREFKYDDHITFEIYKDVRYEDLFQIYTYLDNDLQYGFDTEDGVLYNNMKDELKYIVKELIGGNK